MRFNKVIELVVETTIDDGLGGRTRGDKVLSKYNAHVDELPVETTIKIYGDAYANNIRATVLGRISTKVDDKKFKIKYEDKFYKIVDKSFVRNKTVFFLEMIQDD